MADHFQHASATPRELRAEVARLNAEVERLREALRRLQVHPALTAGASATQLAALRIVREALRDAR